MTDIAQRIVQILEDHRDMSHENVDTYYPYWKDCSCGRMGTPVWEEHIAAILVAELGLTPTDATPERRR